MRKFTRKTLALTTGAVLLGGGAAFAYWTASGSGTGDAATGTTVALTINQTAPVTNMSPGGAVITLAGTFGNTNTGPVRVTAVTATGYTIDPTATAAGCLAGDGHYTLGGSAPVGVDVPVGDPVGAWSGLTITMNNLASNQDFCKNAIVTITYANN